MASFYIDRHSSESVNSQWIKHLQTNAYIRDIDNIISQNRNELQSTIQNAFSEQTKAIYQVCGALNDGFAEVSSHLKNINSNISELRGEISEMAAMLDWRLSMLIEEQRLTNQLLGHIAQILRIPDSQKQRVYYIEQGLKYLKNAYLEGISSPFFIDAMEGFIEAEKIEKKDYITLNRIGQIYLYSQKYLNIPLAQEYFLKSAREAMVEANIRGTTVSNHFTPSGNLPLIYSQNPFTAAQAEAYLYASRTCYLQQKYSEAIELAGKAYRLIPEFVEAGFEQAKYLAANNQESEAAQVLETVINKDRLFSIKTLNDKDLVSKSQILKLLERLQQSVNSIANKKLQECTNSMCSNSKASSIINEIQNNISKNSFLAGMKALDLLNANYSLSYLLYSKGEYKGINQRVISNPQKLLDFVKAETYSPRQLENLRQEIIQEKSTENAYIGILMGGIGGIIIGFFRGCTVNDFSMDWGTLFLAAVVCAGLGALIGYISGQITDTSIK
ncbi:MAG: hypothetical protein HXX14_14550 [Bacteroidetes bacterium]|nr:hypothetical protein [Bacteroidota bacterium]